MRGYRPLPLPYVVCFLVLLVFAGGAGCARSVYRQQADHDAYNLIELQEQRLGEKPDEWEIDPGVDSRLNDATDPDHPPMPQDDPISHELMRTGPRDPNAQSAAPVERWERWI